MNKAILFSAFFLLSLQCLCQETDSLPKRNKIWPKAAAVVASDAAILGVLGSAWYNDQPRASFHFFNDMPEWKQMDKAGHFFSSYHLSMIGSAIFQNNGMDSKKANLWGGIVGFAAVSQIEILDGFSREYGASLFDLAANAAGSLFAWTQLELWNEPRLRLKYSFHQTIYPSQRPEMLGYNLSEEMLKDYNGQTYWISVDIDKFLPQQSSFPEWLNLALGYSAENMVFARDASSPYRQYFLSLDLDLSHLQSKRKWVNILLKGVNMIHLPAPSFEMNRNGMKLHWLYF